ncbi:MAG: hypothetical protein WCG08_01815, partial [Paludibacter sp.]
MKKIYLFVFLGISSLAFAGSPLLIEDFNYPAGDLLTAHGWAQYGTTVSTFPVAVTTGGLTFQGYVGSGIGNAAGLINVGQCVTTPFTAQTQTTGAVYASFLVNVAGNGTATTGSVNFFNFADAGLTSAWRARTFIMPADGNGKYPVSVMFNATVAVASGYVLNPNQTYLFVVKYIINDGAGNDAVSLYVFAEGDNFSTEPTTPTMGPVVKTTSVADIAPAGVTIRQYDAAERITVDGIRVRTEWHLNDDANVVTAMNSLNGNQSLVCYPNPVNDGFVNLGNIASTMKDVQIFDVVGKKVLTQQSISNRLD